MKIYLGLTFNDPQLLPAAPAELVNSQVLSPSGLLNYLETFYSLGTPAVNRMALRTEQYRQVLVQHLKISQRDPFYLAAFRADELATAEELLSRRDELLDAGYPLSAEGAEETPARIRVLHELEALLLADDNALDLYAGPADRLNLLLSSLGEDRHPRLQIFLNETRGLFAPGTRRLLDALESLGDSISALPEPEAPLKNNDLGSWQHKLRAVSGIKKGSPEPVQGSLFGEETSSLATAAVTEQDLTGDGSLVILRAQRETHLAAYLARLLRDAPDWRPGALLTVRNQTLDNALVTEGLPSLGVPSTSLARPSLQVLKLVTAFLWEPLEVDRIMEFVSLVTKPLDWRLAQRMAVHLADTPGMFGPRWVAMVEGFFRELQADGETTNDQIATIRKQYDDWFRRRRISRDGRIPKFDLRQLFFDLREWALLERTEKRKKDVQLKRTVGDYAGLLVLSAQAQRAMELLDAQPETDLNFLEVERLVRTVYEPAPTHFQPKEQGSISTIFAPASAAKLPGTDPLKKLIWWDFIEHEPDYFFSRYYPNELEYLQSLGARPNGPAHHYERSAWQQLRPVLHTREQLVLCLPERVDGSPVEAHPLFGDLEAAFPDGALDRITINVDAAGQATGPLVTGHRPAFSPVAIHPLSRPVPQLSIERLQQAQPREREAPTAMEDLLYYPHKWIFRHQLRLQGTPILSIASENRLRGNLSHLFIERLLNKIKSGEVAMERAPVREWIDDNADRLLAQEGAVMLEYGQEPERVQFIRTMQYSAWSLVHYIKENGWSVRGSEQRLEGELEPMGGQFVRGRADLVLEREKNGVVEVAVVDLKWRGKSVFKNLLRNAKDVQLCLYAEFIRQNLPPDGEDKPPYRQPERVHTAYYVLRDALMLSRDELAFANIETVAGAEEAPVVQASTLKKIRATYNWRWEQFADGVVEVRCNETLGYLEDLYQDLPHDELLEMEADDARFDDYRSLIGLVR